MKKIIISSIMLAAAATAAFAQSDLSAGDPLAGTGPFSDSSFQDMLETSEGGYLNSRNTMIVRSDFGVPGDLRDSVISRPRVSLKTSPEAVKRVSPEERPGLPDLPQGHYKVTFAGESGPVGSYVWPVNSSPRGYAREYVLLGVSVKGLSYDKLLPRLEKAGFRFAGEKNSYRNKKKEKIVILGWAPYSSMAAIAGVGGVDGVAIEKKASGMPMKARVRFTLKVPFHNKPNSFVPGFIKRLENEGGFTAESWFRLPRVESDSKFSVFDVVGTIPVDMIGGLSRSPFVASVEFKDSSL